MQGLRGDVNLQERAEEGIASLILSRNKLTDQFILDLLPALNYDQYLRVHFYIFIFFQKLDLSENNITKLGLHELKKCARNGNLICLDLRNNPGYNNFRHKKFVMILLKNIQNTKQKTSVKISIYFFIA
jgi:hypothetical protein